MALAAAPDVPGFQALSPLGYGPTSTIYSAQSTTLGRWVSLTVYSASLPDERSQKKFRRAFELTRRLGVHPAAVTMLDCGLTSDKHAFVATEIYERGTLEARSQGRPLPVDDVLRIGVALAGALETAHRAEVIHGGVHPARVLLGNDGEPALADLGLVALVEKGGLAALTGPVSTAYHAPPEVLEGEAVTPASDVFSLASTLYTALAGRPPYQRDSEDDTPASLLLRILQHDVPPVGRPDVPPSLEDALRRALSCSPRDRPGRGGAGGRARATGRGVRSPSLASCRPASRSSASAPPSPPWCTCPPDSSWPWPTTRERRVWSARPVAFPVALPPRVPAPASSPPPPPPPPDLRCCLPRRSPGREPASSPTR
jgi:serine/threonine-protein kinase PknK